MELHNYIIRIHKDQLDILIDLLAEKAIEIEDDGNEGDPDAAMLWKVHAQLFNQ
jgi:hypothetical protein